MKTKCMLFLFAVLIMAATAFFLSPNVSLKKETLSTIKVIEPNAIYGPAGAEIVLTIGNGGAGPTCVLQALSEDFIESENLHIRIAWVQTITRLTLENLKEKKIDLSLTYEADLELKGIQEKWASNRTPVFNDHFLIVGPKDNPAGISPHDSASLAFEKIAKHGAFFSRNDLSGTNQREREIWEMVKLKPWQEPAQWYISAQTFPVEALKKADNENLYTLTDRGTLLAVYEDLKNTAVYIQDDDLLMNRCHAMLQDKPSPYAEKFLKYLQSSRAQALIAKYAGKDKKDCIDCCPLFTSAMEDRFLETNCLQRLGLNPI